VELRDRVGGVWGDIFPIFQAKCRVLNIFVPLDSLLISVSFLSDVITQYLFVYNVSVMIMFNCRALPGHSAVDMYFNQCTAGSFIYNRL